MNSGIKVSPEFLKLFEDLKLRRKDLPYFTGVIGSDEKTVEVGNQGPENATFDCEKFLDDMKTWEVKEKGAYIVVDYKGNLIVNMCLDDNLKTKKKMLYASTKEVVKRACDGHKKFLELDLDDFMDEFKKEKPFGY